MLALVIGAVVALGAWRRSAPPTKLPDVAVEDAHGAPISLGAFKGRVLLVDFWASWCASCKVSFPELDALSHEFAPKGAVILAVNVDEQRRDADAFLASRPHTMMLLFDAKGRAPAAFGVEAMPTSFLIDRAGTIRFTHAGYAGSVATQYRSELARLLAEPEHP